MRSISSGSNSVYYTIARDHPEVLDVQKEYLIVLSSADINKELEYYLADQSDYPSSYQIFEIPLTDLRPYGTWYMKIYWVNEEVETLVHTGLLRVSE